MGRKKMTLLLAGAGLCIVLSLSYVFYREFYAIEAFDAKPILEPLDMQEVSIENYVTYDLEDVAFRFIVIDLNLVDNKPINLSLDSFKSQEGIVLSELDFYKRELSDKGYDLSGMNLSTSLQSSNNTAKVRLFMPVLNYKQKKVSLWVTSPYGHRQELVFDITKAQGQASDLGKRQLLVTDPTQNHPELDPPHLANRFFVGSLRKIDPSLVLYKGGDGRYTPVQFRPRSTLLVVDVTADFQEPVVLSAARLKFDQDKTYYFALASEYVLDNGKNLIQTRLSQGLGSLIFEIDKDWDQVLDQGYVLEMRLNNQFQWLAFSSN